KILRSYFYNSAGNKKIDLKIDGKIYPVVTDKKGNFELTIESQQVETVQFFHHSSTAKLDVLETERRFYSFCEDQVLIISDIDDTILVSHSARFFSKLWLMLFKPVSKRKTVEESELAYRLLKKAHFPFAYVSASEYNLFSLVSTFIKIHELPMGPIYLRPHQEFRNLFVKTQR